MNDYPFSIHTLRERLGNERLAAVLQNNVDKQLSLTVDELSLLLQLSLHLPRFDEKTATEDDSVLIDEAKRLVTLLFEARKSFAHKIDPITTTLDNLQFRELDDRDAGDILKNFHYIRSFRRTSKHFGLVRERVDDTYWPVALASLAPLDVQSILDVQDIALDKQSLSQSIQERALALSRVYAFPNCPHNALSFLFAKLRKWLQEHETDYEYLLTYVNPNLGFTGASYRADNWTLLGSEKGIVYKYLDNDYVTDRALQKKEDEILDLSFTTKKKISKTNITQSKSKLKNLDIYIRGIKNKRIEIITPTVFDTWPTYTLPPYEEALDSSSQVEALGSRFIRFYLRGMKETYYQHVGEYVWDDQIKVRFNIMTPVNDTDDETLKIIYVDYPQDYYQEEFKRDWHAGEGKCGEAWETKEQVVYAADIESEKTRFTNMDMSEPFATGIQSVLSTPIVYQDKRIGVLNVDSLFGCEKTKLHQDSVSELCQDGARDLGKLLTTF